VIAECGPYAFREVNEKKNIKYLDRNRTSFTLITTLTFEPDLSGVNKSDMINFLNIPAMVKLFI
jgi:hypothetical protein